ncbi:MAG: hypothetical protein AW08_00333 [Candidatus Accumulibacter adjunctus]|uniref:Uncharacterized protein n=1 Tax=Candidatus Accumulibacter adjunctus TaxID=1454001 RepID=A0A011NYY5_9PROT|nr:MAG: hypothetical protein AW08_00333 [Candidatus Accumulibacter adjunctus]
MAGLPHQGFATVLADPGRQPAGALDVVDDRLPGTAAQDVGGKEHQLAVRVDDLAVTGDDAETVAVTVEGEADLGPAVAQRRDQILQVFGLRRVGMVVREAAVDGAEQFDEFATEGPEELRRDATGDAVAAVDGDLHRPCQADVAADPRQVRRLHVGAAGLAGTVLQAIGVDALPDALDRLAGQRLAGDDHLQSVVVGRVVAAGDGDATLAAEFVRREVDHRCRHAADVDGVDAGHADAGHQGLRQLRSGQAPVTADGDRSLAAFDRQGTESMADAADDGGCQRAADDAADVVGLEDLLRQGSVHLKPRSGNSAGLVAAARRAAPGDCR